MPLFQISRTSLYNDILSTATPFYIQNLKVLFNFDIFSTQQLDRIRVS